VVLRRGVVAHVLEGPNQWAAAGFRYLPVVVGGRHLVLYTSVVDAVAVSDDRLASFGVGLSVYRSVRVRSARVLKYRFADDAEPNYWAAVLSCLDHLESCRGVPLADDTMFDTRSLVIVMHTPRTEACP
jgi:hypothetical protein